MSAWTGLARPGVPGVIRGRTIFLRPPRTGDYDVWADLRGASREFLQPWEPTWARDELSKTAFRTRVRRYDREARDDRGYAFFVFRQADDALLGGINLSVVRRGVAQTASVGYWMGEAFAGQGHMTEALRMLARFSFSTLRLHRLEAACLPNNEASRTVLSRVGFREEGLARAYLRIDGVWRDHVLFGLLEEDVQ